MALSPEVYTHLHPQVLKGKIRYYENSDYGSVSPPVGKHKLDKHKSLLLKDDYKCQKNFIATKMDIRENTTKRENKMKDEKDHRLNNKLSQSTTSLASFDSGVDTMSSAGSIETKNLEIRIQDLTNEIDQMKTDFQHQKRDLEHQINMHQKRADDNETKLKKLQNELEYSEQRCCKLNEKLESLETANENLAFQSKDFENRMIAQVGFQNKYFIQMSTHEWFEIHNSGLKTKIRLQKLKVLKMNYEKLIQKIRFRKLLLKFSL